MFSVGYNFKMFLLKEKQTLTNYHSIFFKNYICQLIKIMAKIIFLSPLFIMICFFSNAQQNKYYNGLSKKNWVKTKPFITFCGKEAGAVLLDSISVKSLITIKNPYTFRGLSINFGGVGFQSPILVGYGASTKESITFYKVSPFQEIIKKCQIGTKITLTNIKVFKDKIIYDVPDVTYIVN